VGLAGQPQQEDNVKKSTSLVSLALPLGAALVTACSGSPDGAGSAPTDTTQTATAAPSQVQPAVQSVKDHEGQLLARKSFNGGTETLSLYDLGRAFSMEWAGNPTGGHSVVAQAFNELRLSEVWELIAAPGQEAPPALVEAMDTEPLRAGKIAALSPVVSGSASTDLGRGAVVENVVLNYCDNGGFWTDFGVPAGASVGSGWFWSDPGLPGFVLLPTFGEYSDTPYSRVVTYHALGFAGFAVCPTNDGGWLNGSWVAPGAALGVKVWSGYSCGFDLGCCVTGGSCTACTVPGTTQTWTWVDSCPESNGQCTDGNLSSIVTYDSKATGHQCQ
jgi:hypothetical protein